MKMNDKGLISTLAGIATLLICLMTFISFGISVGLWESDFWQSDIEGASIVGYDGYWGEDITVTYTDGTKESVKAVSNSYWSAQSIRNDGSKSISSLQYCISALIPISDTFNTLEYHCSVSIVQDNIIFYQISYEYVSFVDVAANEWTQVLTVPLNVQNICMGWNDGIYHISFENTGTIEGLDVPVGLLLDISIENDNVSFVV